MMEIVATLRQSKASLDRLVVPSSAGVYVFFLVPGSRLGPFKPLPDQPIYVGATSHLNEREHEHHFSGRHTGFSSPRRSIGSILREELRLNAIPRAPGPAESNVRNFRYQPHDEQRLSSWMRENLLVAVHPCPDPFSLEDDLIAALCPILNLTKCANPYSAEIKRLRKICADEARANRVRM